MTNVSESFATCDYCLFAAIILPTMTPKTIIDMINFSWANKILDEYMHNINTCLPFLNFCGPPSKSLEYKHYCNMNSWLASAHREQQIS